MDYYFKIAVSGRGGFPLDQLRRYEMFPLDIYTCNEIAASLDMSLGNSDREYTLGMYAKSVTADGNMIDRFASFGFIAKTEEIWKEGKLFFTSAGGYEVSES